MVIIKVKLPRLLDKDTLAFVRRIRPVKATVELNITPLSTASLTLQEGDNLPARSYIEMFTAMGSAGIYRVRAPQNTYGNGEDSSITELEHAVTEVGDWLVKAEINENMQVATAMRAVFSHYGGNKWQLNTNNLGTAQVAVQTDHDIVLQAMLNILSQVPDRMMYFDFTTSPWTIRFKQRSTTVSAEGRLGRNMRTAVITYDDSALCTRAYYECESTSGGSVDGIPVFDASKNYSAGSYVNYSSKLYLLPDGHTSGTAWADTTKSEVTNIPSTTWAYVDADTIGQWGIVERTVSTGSDFTQAEALRVASDYVRKHRNPKLSIQIDAGELSSITHEPLDTFEIGKLFRLALPRYGVTVEECITGMSWDDVYGKPYSITVNLADEEDTTVTFLHEVEETGTSTSVGGGGGGGKKQDDKWKEYRTKIDQTDMYLDLWARRYNKAEEILQQAGLYIDSNGALIYAQDNERNVGAKLQVQADKIGLVVGTNQDGNYIKVAEISTAINDAGEGVAYLNADHVNISSTQNAHLLSGSIAYDANGNLVLKETSAGGVLVEHNDSGTTSTFGIWDKGNLTGGVMVEQINGQTGTVTRLKGSTIVIGNDQTIDAEYRGQTLDGTLTAITSDFTRVHTLLADKIEAEDVTTDMITSRLANATVSNIASLAAGDILCDSFSLKGALQNVFVSDTSGGRIELTLVPVSGSNRTINFNIADTQFYKDGVSAAKASMGVEADSTNHAVKVVEGGASSLAITCEPVSVVYSQANHNYAYVFQSKAGTSVVATASGTTGTEAFEAGENQFSLASVTLEGAGGYITPIDSTKSLKLSASVVKYEKGSDYTLYERGSYFSYKDVGSTTVYTRSNMKKLKYVGTITGQTGYYYKVDSSGTANYETSEYSPTTRTGYRIGGEVTGTNLGSPVACYVPSTSGTTYYQAGTTVYRYGKGSTVSDTYYTKS